MTERECLEWLHRKGGLGLDVHERIEQVLIATRTQGADDAQPVAISNKTLVQLFELATDLTSAQQFCAAARALLAPSVLTDSEIATMWIQRPHCDGPIQEAIAFARTLLQANGATK